MVRRSIFDITLFLYSAAVLLHAFFGGHINIDFNINMFYAQFNRIVILAAGLDYVPNLQNISRVEWCLVFYLTQYKPDNKIS
jgi:hypothetical protein